MANIQHYNTHTKCKENGKERQHSVIDSGIGFGSTSLRPTHMSANKKLLEMSWLLEQLCDRCHTVAHPSIDRALNVWIRLTFDLMSLWLNSVELKIWPESGSTGSHQDWTQLNDSTWLIRQRLRWPHQSNATAPICHHSNLLTLNVTIMMFIRVSVRCHHLGHLL